MALVVRKNYLANPGAQFRVVIFLASVAFVSALLMMMVVYFQLKTLLPPEAAPDALQSVMLRMGIVALVMVIYFVVAGIVLTNRIVGPIYNLERQLLKHFAGEKIPPIKFRDDDEFQDLPPLINRLIDPSKK